ncbi:muscarinic acetylcholine receptor DM1-like [Oppia nitens]|uniref:muscarinic acetylcholine receptor DM1-like n=1 Tax=Oppia nitens TaxID=1686743 RepID=UPI0023DC5663|nr:muscarinic acetylcholine receptor DM1-like [Oppia nitens]
MNSSSVSSFETTEYPTSVSSSSSETTEIAVQAVVAAVGVLLSVLTIVGNVLVLIAFKTDKALQTAPNCFLLSLACADFLIGLVSMPLSLVYILAAEWPLGPLLCDVWLAVDYLNSNASVLNLLLISFDRYFSVTRPLTYRARRTTRRACALIAAAWLVSALLWPPWIFAWPAIEGRRTVPRDQCYIPFLESNAVVTVATALVAFWLPVSLMCFLYFRIWRETENRFRDLALVLTPPPSRPVASCFGRKTVPPPSDSIYTIVIHLDAASDGNATVTMLGSEDEERPQSCSRLPALQPKSERKAAKTLSAILAAFVVTWTPYNVLVLIKTFSPTSVDSDGVWWQFAYSLCYINSTLNPLLYALCNRSFRNTYVRILTCRTRTTRRTTHTMGRHADDALK